MTHSALILVDIQNDYFPSYAGAKMPLPDMDAAAENAAKLLAAARSNGTLVVHVRHIAAPETIPFFLPDTPGSETHASVAPQPGETVVQKHAINSFQNTNLESVLKEAQISDVTVCGAMSHVCIDGTVRAASDMGYAVTVAEDACAAPDVTYNGVDVPAKQVHATIMAPLAMAYAQVLSTQECL